MQKVKSIFHRVFIFAFFLVILLADTQARAVTTSFYVYSSRSAFAEAVPSALVQGWDSEMYTDDFPISNGSADDKGIKYYCSVGNAVVDTNDFLVTTWDGSLGNVVPNYNYVDVNGNPITGYFLSTISINFVFPTPILAFAIDINTESTVNTAYQATTNLVNVASSYYDPFPDFPNYSVGQFIGFTSTEPFSEVTISGVSGLATAYTLDTLRFQPVPLPPSLLLLGSGLLGLAGWRRLRKG